MALVDSDDDAPPPPRASCRACGHDHAPGTTCDVCGHHRRVDEDGDDVPRPRLGHDEPIIEVIDKFLCLGAFEHTSKEDVLLACGIRTVMNSVPQCTPCCSSRQIDVFTAPRDANDGTKLDLGETVRKLEQLHVKAKRADEAGVPNRVLVYCMSGHSRAPSVAVAYLMFSERRKLADALRALQRRYPRGHKGITLKPSDLATLEAFERELYPDE